MTVEFVSAGHGKNMARVTGHRHFDAAEDEKRLRDSEKFFQKIGTLKEGETFEEARNRVCDSRI